MNKLLIKHLLFQGLGEGCWVQKLITVSVECLSKSFWPLKFLVLILECLVLTRVWCEGLGHHKLVAMSHYMLVFLLYCTGPSVFMVTSRCRVYGSYLPLILTVHGMPLQNICPYLPCGPWHMLWCKIHLLVCLVWDVIYVEFSVIGCVTCETKENKVYSGTKINLIKIFGLFNCHWLT